MMIIPLTKGKSTVKDIDSLVSILKQLKRQGNYPSIYRRGRKWRFHVNGAGNFWADHTDPIKAAEKAIRAWEAAGKPKDGYASKGCK